MTPDPVEQEYALQLTRRQFFGRTALGLGTGALATLLQQGARAAVPGSAFHPGLSGLPHAAPRAKRVIYLFMSGGPSQIDLLDYKPALQGLHGTELPDSVRGAQRVTTMTSGQDSFPVVASKFAFRQHGQSGQWFSELLPHIGGIADDLCVVKSMNTEAINHDPATTFVATGSQLPGRPGLGAWLSYGLGSENENLPAFVVMLSKGSPGVNMQPLYSRLWGNGFLPSQHQGVVFRSTDESVLFLDNPSGIDAGMRKRLIDGIARMNQHLYQQFADPEIVTRIQQYEMAYRMQTSVPDLMDLSEEPQHTLDLYGPDVHRPGSFARNCLVARRLAERGTRFVQLFHQGWDQHDNLPRDIALQCKDVDQPSAALVQDLKQRGLLEDTLVIWGGEFGRSVYSQGVLQQSNYGRDHHGRCFTIWMAGGGIQPGLSYGETDDYSYNIVRDGVHIHDFNATVLHLAGIEHERLVFRFQGRDFRLTDVEGEVVHGVLA